MSRNTNKLVAGKGPAKASAPSRPRTLKGGGLKGSAIGRSLAIGEAQLVQEVCAITNPFCEASRGSKWPDESAGQTLSVPVRTRYNLVTDSAGRVGKLFAPTYTLGVIDGTGTATDWLADTDGGELVATAYLPEFVDAHQFRLVSGGVKVTPVTSAMNSQGVINVIELPPVDNGNDYLLVHPNQKSVPSYDTLPLRSTDSIYAIMRPSGPEARMFHPTFFADDSPLPLASFTTNDWTSIWVGVEGGQASSTVAIVDIYLNFEVMVQSSAALGYLTTPSAIPNSDVTRASTAISRYGAIRRGTDASIDRGWMSQAWGALKDGGAFVVKNAGNLLTLGKAASQAYYGNAPGAAATLGAGFGPKMIMDVD